MSIINRNYFINKARERPSTKKLRRKSKTYYNVSCPRCGDPKESNNMSLNRFGVEKSKRLKCRLCHKLLMEI